MERVSWSDPAGAQKLVDFQVKEPFLTFEGELSFYLHPVEIHLGMFPGHTPHTIAVRVEPDGVLFAGDNVVNGAPPFFHESECPRVWIHSLRRMKAWKFRKLVPGHGDLSNSEIIEVMIQTIEKVMEMVQDGITQGISDEEIQEKVRYLPLFKGILENGPQKDFWRQLERRGIGRMANRLRNLKDKPKSL